MTDDILPGRKPFLARHRKTITAVWFAVLAILERHGVDTADLIILSGAFGVYYVTNGNR